MSSRTLKPRLHEHGFTFRQLLDEIRCRDGIRLLQGTALSIEDIAYHLGYTAPGNFSRAFRSWMGTTPAAFRKQGAMRSTAHDHHAKADVIVAPLRFEAQAESRTTRPTLVRPASSTS